MIRTLYGRLSMMLAISLLVVAALYSILMFSSTRHYQQQVDQRLNLGLAAKLVNDRRLIVSGQIDEDALEKTFADYMAINPNIEIYLLDASGRILSYSADPGKVKRNRVSLDPIHAFLAGQHLPLLGDDPRNFEGRKVFSVAPIPDTDQPKGFLYVVLRGEEYNDIANFIHERLIWRQSAWALMGSLTIGLMAGLVLFYLLTRRINRLSAEMDLLRSNGFTHYLPGKWPKKQHNDEIDRLAINFDAMAQKIVSQLDELKKQDRLRRDLIANVSHDLRTPMAILNGYLETLVIKRKQMSDEEAVACLNAAMNSSERLTRLIHDLFELARLDALSAAPLPEKFNIIELAQDILQKFSMKGRDKGLELALAARDKDCFVVADIGQISSVFENLLGNAIKATDSGSVTLKIEKNHDAIRVTVSDTGPGIAEDELPHLFERFYQGQRANTSGGLGLAICARIVALHGGKLEVSSLPGQGSRFFFTIPSDTPRNSA